MKLSDLPIEEIDIANIPFYHKRGAENGNAYVRFGQAKRVEMNHIVTPKKSNARGVSAGFLCPML